MRFAKSLQGYFKAVDLIQSTVQPDADERITTVESFIVYFTTCAKEQLKTLIRGDDQKYKYVCSQNLVAFPDPDASFRQKSEFLAAQEPLDYMNLVKTYTTFVQFISTLCSLSSRDDFVDKIDDKDYELK